MSTDCTNNAELTQCTYIYVHIVLTTTSIDWHCHQLGSFHRPSYPPRSSTLSSLDCSRNYLSCRGSCPFPVVVLKHCWWWNGRRDTEGDFQGLGAVSLRSAFFCGCTKDVCYKGIRNQGGGLLCLWTLSGIVLNFLPLCVFFCSLQLCITLYQWEAVCFVFLYSAL